MRWIFEGLTWKRSDPWMISFVECTAGRPGSLLGTWWPAILAALVEDVDTARTEGFNRIINRSSVRCGHRNLINYQQRILSHVAVTRPHRSAASTGRTPFKFVEIP